MSTSGFADCSQHFRGEIMTKTRVQFSLALFWIAMASGACSTSSQTVEHTPRPAVDTPADWSEERSALEAEFEYFLVTTSIPPQILEGGMEELGRVLDEKIEAQQDLENRIVAFIDGQGGDEESLSWAILRLSQTYLNVACELDGVQPPRDVSASLALEYRLSIADRTLPIFDSAIRALGQVVELDAAPWSEQAARLEDDLHRVTENPTRVCADIAAYWSR